jgi:hypothetical protein
MPRGLSRRRREPGPASSFDAYPGEPGGARRVSRRRRGNLSPLWIAVVAALAAFGSRPSLRLAGDQIELDGGPDDAAAIPSVWLRLIAPSVAAAGPDAPVYKIEAPSAALQQEFARENYKRDPKSGNYLSPKVFSRTLDQPLVPIFINGRYLKDLKGQTIFLRESIRDKLVHADEAMFAKRHEHLVVTYGFRSNDLQRELFRKLNGAGKVAPPGGSFHETGMALDLQNWHDAQRFMIEAGFVGGCYGIEEDLVHYSIGEITKASNMSAFKRCTLKEIPENIVKGMKKAGSATGGAFGKLIGK